jgi:hypothetical protein
MTATEEDFIPFGKSNLNATGGAAPSQLGTANSKSGSMLELRVVSRQPQAASRKPRSFTAAVKLLQLHPFVA